MARGIRNGHGLRRFPEAAIPLLIFACAILVLPNLAIAQSTALLTGTIVDPSGAVVAAAEVVCRNANTGLIYKTSTNAEGLFRLPDLPIGSYSLTVTHPGFAQLVRSGITLLTGQSVDLRLLLSVGPARQILEVTSAAPVVESTVSVVQTSMDSRNMQELPLNGRNALQLVVLAPGTQASYTGTEGDQQEQIGISTNGLRTLDNNYQLDGVRYVNREWNSAPVFPNPDTLQEFTVKSSNFSAAESGAGATVLLSTRSGTNHFHGSAFEFVRNDAFDARNFFASTTTPFKRNQYGGTFGGPIAKDKTFFFVSYQGTRKRGGASPPLITVPSAAARGGDFSALGRVIIDPLTRQPFPDNKVDPRRFDPLSVKLLPFVPLPTLPNNRFAGRPNTDQNDSQFSVRLDHNFGAKDHFTARYFYDEFDFQRATSKFPGIFAQNYYLDQNLLVSDTHIFSPNLLLTASLGYTRTARTQAPTEPTTTQALGQEVPEAVVGAAPELRVNVNGYFNLFSGGGLLGRPEVFDCHAHFNWSHGKHLLQFGMDIERDRMYSADTSFASGQSIFNGSRTGLPTVTNSGDAFADFLLGLPSRFFQGARTPQNFRETKWQPWIQDDWKVLPRLTLNLGLRWEPWLPPYDLLGPATAWVPGVRSVVAPNAPVGLLFSGDPGLRESIFPADWKNLAPRVGFAWDLRGNGNTVVRAAYGIFYRDAPLNLERTANSGSAFRSQSTDILNPPSFSDPYAGFPGGAPFPFTQPPLSALKSYQFLRPVITSTLDPASRTGYTQEWNFTVERQLRTDLGLSISYVGNHTVKIMATRQANPAAFRPGAMVGNTQARRLYPELGPLAVASPWEFENYNGLQISVTKRTTRGLSTVANYVYSKCLDNDSSQTIGADAGGGGGINPFNLNAYYGPCDYNDTHHVKISLVYDIPRLNGLHGPAAAILNRWQLTGIITAHTGFPFTVKSGRDNSLSGQNLDNADLTGDPRRPGGVSPLAEYFNTSAFALNALGTFGTAGRNSLWGPGAWNVDFGVVKDIPISEPFHTQFRVEAFNLFNHANFNTPENTRTNPNFGKILSAGDPRVLQLALKLSF